MTKIKAFEVTPEAGAAAADKVALSYAQRLIRRKKLTSQSGLSFYVDLPQTISVNAGAGFVLEDGRVIEVVADVEPLLRVTGPQITRYAWHIGNRHTPCTIAEDHLLIAVDPVLKAMLLHLGAQVDEVQAPFTPEGGAYGHGRTMGHEHGTGHGADHAHAHSHDHNHDHSQDHNQDYGHAYTHEHDHG